MHEYFQSHTILGCYVFEMLLPSLLKMINIGNVITLQLDFVRNHEFGDLYK